MKKTAEISPCGKYRFSLSRIWEEEKPKVLFIMLNPSTADSEIDDPTIRRCIGFARNWGFGGINVVNLFPFRATSPNSLFHQTNLIGNPGENTITISRYIDESALIICAWGNGPIVRRLMNRNEFYRHQLTMILSNKKDLNCLGTNFDGYPKHPLYVKYTTYQPFNLNL